MVPTCGAGVTAAAGTSLAHHLFRQVFALTKSLQLNRKHSESPHHAFAHCEVFATAAPLRARTSISVSFSGQPLSWPLRVLGLVSHYLTNYLMRRRPIVRRRSFLEQQFSTHCSLSSIILSFPRLFLISRDVIDVLLSRLRCLAASTCMFKPDSDSSNLLQDKQVSMQLVSMDNE